MAQAEVEGVAAPIIVGGPVQEASPLRRHLRRIGLIINLKAVIVSGLAVGATLLCVRFGLVANFPLTLIATAIIFPIVFSISGAYKRRETALNHYGQIKAHGRAIYFAARDWLAESDPEILREAGELLGGLLTSCRTLFAGERQRMIENEATVYRDLSRLSLFIRSLRQKGLASGEVSRCNQYLSKIVVSFETMKHIYQYRTPLSLRAYSSIFIFVLPILYGPYFAHLATEYSRGLEYMMPVLFSLIFVGLENIQSHLENPFDQVGEDDIAINAEKFVERLKLEP